MKTLKKEDKRARQKGIGQDFKHLKTDFFEHLWEENCIYMKKDIKEIINVADKISDHSRQLEDRLTERIVVLELSTGKLEKEVSEFKIKRLIKA